MSEIQNREEAQGFLNKYQGDVRASWADRKKITTHLREAHKDGRLTSEQFHLRAEDALASESQVRLGMLIRDLPKPRKSQGLWPRLASNLATAHKEHKNALHALLTLFIVMGTTTCIVLPDVLVQGLWGNTAHPSGSAWVFLPIIAIVVGTASAIINFIAWGCE